MDFMVDLKVIKGSVTVDKDVFVAGPVVRTVAVSNPVLEALQCFAEQGIVEVICFAEIVEDESQEPAPVVQVPVLEPEPEPELEQEPEPEPEQEPEPEPEPELQPQSDVGDPIEAPKKSPRKPRTQKDKAE